MEIVFQQREHTRKYLLFPSTVPSKRPDIRQTHQRLRLVPQVQDVQHIAAHQQPQLRVRVLRMHCANRIHAVTLPLPAQLQVGHLCTGHCAEGQTRHFQALRIVGRTLR